MIESTQKGKARPGTAIYPKGHSVELLISSLLRGGALVSLGFLLVGTFLSFMDHPNDLHSPEELQQLIVPGATFPHTLTDVGSGALHLQGPALVMVGLLWLIATPVVVVAVSILMFAYQQDRDFVIITLVVLMLLMASFFLGKTEHGPTPAPIRGQGTGPP